MNPINPIRTLVLPLAATFLALTTSYAQGDVDIWTVDDNGPADFNDIQSAIDHASDGDEIHVAAGTYTGSGNYVVDFNGKKLWLKGSIGPFPTIISGEGVRRGIRCKDVAYSLNQGGAALNYFTITDCVANVGDKNGGALKIVNSTLHIWDCLIEGNSAQNGGGIYCEDSTLISFDNLFAQNYANNKGGGIYLKNSDSVQEYCSWEKNKAGNDGGALYSNSESGAQLVYGSFCGSIPNHTSGPGTVYPYNTTFKSFCNGMYYALANDLVMTYVEYTETSNSSSSSSSYALSEEIQMVGPSAEMADGLLAVVDLETGLVHGYDVLEDTYEGVLFGSELIQNPVAMAFDEERAFVADSAGLIHIFNTSTGMPAGALGSASLSPIDLEVGIDGFIWVTSMDQSAPLQAWEPNIGGVMHFLGDTTSGLDAPGELAVLQDGSLLVSDRVDSEIYRFVPTTGEITLFLSAEAAEGLGLGQISDLSFLASDMKVFVTSDRGLSKFTHGGLYLGDVMGPDGAPLENILGFVPISEEFLPDAWNPADFNHDGAVNGGDLTILLGSWGTDSPGIDLNNDGVVDGRDLAILLAAWE